MCAYLEITLSIKCEKVGVSLKGNYFDHKLNTWIIDQKSHDFFSFVLDGTTSF